MIDLQEMTQTNQMSDEDTYVRCTVLRGTLGDQRPCRTFAVTTCQL